MKIEWVLAKNKMTSLAEKLRKSGRVHPLPTKPVVPTVPTVPAPQQHVAPQIMTPANADHAQMMELFARRMNGGTVQGPSPAEQMAYQMATYQPTYEELHAEYLRQQRTPEQYLQQREQIPVQAPPPPPVWQRPIPSFEYGAASIHDAFNDNSSMEAMLRLAATLNDPTMADMPKADRVPFSTNQERH